MYFTYFCLISKSYILQAVLTNNNLNSLQCFPFMQTPNMFLIKLFSNSALSLTETSLGNLCCAPLTPSTMKTKRSLHVATPLRESLPLSKIAGTSIYLKLDSSQPTGSFKIRGIGHLCKTVRGHHYFLPEDLRCHITTGWKKKPIWASEILSLLILNPCLYCINMILYHVLIIVFISCIITVVLIIIVLMGSQQGLSHVCLVNACCICNEKWRGCGLL